MELENMVVTKERNILAIVDKETQKRVYADLSNGVLYGLSTKPVISVPVMFRKAHTLLQPLDNDALEQEDKQIKRLIQYLYELYTYTRPQAGDMTGWENMRKICIGFYERVTALGLTMDTSRTDVMMYHAQETKLTKDLVDALKADYNGVLSRNNIDHYNLTKVYGNTVETVLMRYPAVFHRTLKEGIEFLIRNFTDKQFVNWMLKCLGTGMIGAIGGTDWVDYARHLYKTVQETKNPINYDQDFFRNYIRIIIDKETKEDEASIAKLANIYNPKYLCDLSEFGLVMVFPKNKSDFATEGMNNRNCVANYYEAVVNGREFVVFIRKINAPEKSYITCSFSSNKRNINQYLFAGNERAQNREKGAYDKIIAHLQNL